MAGAMLMSLTLATLVSGTQYVDYSGVKMPQYGGNADYDGPRDALTSSDEYHDHPPDAPAPLDYKYEEDVNGKTNKALRKEVEETEDWQKHKKKHRKPTRPTDDSNLETFNKYSPDEIVPILKASHRFSKHRPRLKARNFGGEDVAGLKRPVNYVRIRDTDMSDADSKDDFRDDKGVDFDDEQSRYVNKETTMRVARRKPRDRFVQSHRPEEDMQRERESDVESDELVSRRQNTERERNIESDEMVSRGLNPERGRNVESDVEIDELVSRRLNPERGRNFESDVEIDELVSRRLKPERGRKVESDVESDELVSRRLNPERGRNVEYPPSYEERRLRPVNKMFKNPADRYGSATVSDDEEGKRPQLNQKDSEYSEYYDMNRVNNIKNKLPNLPRRTTTARTATTRSKATLGAHAVKPFRRVNAFAPFPDFNEIRTTRTSTTRTMSTTNTTSTTSTTSTPTTTMKPIVDMKALSIAEKSRLSILKKAQRKETSRNESTQKPPVLLQVTNKLQTVVMVEPPTELEPWLRAREVSDDTPERLDKVKRMMRHKLVASAKNIQDLTDHWDDMVCDYIDVSLLDSTANTNCASVLLTSITLLVSFTIRCIR